MSKNNWKNSVSNRKTSSRTDGQLRTPFLPINKTKTVCRQGMLQELDRGTYLSQFHDEQCNRILKKRK